MFALPWKTVAAPTGERVLVFASRFDGRGFGSARVMLGAGIGIRRGALHAPGCLGASLWARPLRGKYHTLSAWQDEESLAAFARSAAHRDGVRALRAVGPVDGVLISWWENAADWRPNWKAAISRAAAATPGPYAGPGAAEREPTA
jgi:heme-degrading monooxygenase HmoA